MLVEDDNNLREIYEARLLAEGYEIVSAKDGEEALALAVKEKPDLIISDVMMPKISGFDMLDILRSTPEIKNTKVIMMTALSQAEDKSRADKLGADRYLVKSQVTLEDVARVAREVISGEEESPSSPLDPAPADPISVSMPVTADPGTPATPPPATEPPTQPEVPPATPTPMPSTPPSPAPLDPVTPSPAPTDPPASDPPVADEPDEINSPASDPLLLDPVLTEGGDSSTAADPDTDTAQSVAAESAVVEDQIKDFVAQPVAEEVTPPEPSTDATPPVAKDESDALNVPAPDTTQATADLSSVAAPVETITVQAPPTEAPSDTTAPSLPEPTAASADEAANAAELVAPTPDEYKDGNVPVAHKKVITPLNEVVQSAPDLNDLLAKQKQKDALAPGVSVIPPADSVIQPGGATVTPASNGTPPTTTEPGNIVHPSGGDPASIAL